MKQEKELKQLLTGQKFVSSEYDLALLESTKTYARAYARATEGVGVVSDFHNSVCYIYAGKFGQYFFGLSEYLEDYETAFENVIFDRVVKEDLLERHILELSFIAYLKNVPANQKSEYLASCFLRIYNEKRSDTMQTLHTTRYLNCLSNGSIWCGLCTYSPFPQTSLGLNGGIVNTYTGTTVNKEEYRQNNNTLLSNRHRQDLLSVLRVKNTVAAVEIGIKMNLI